MSRTFTYHGEPVEFEPGESVMVAVLKAHKPVSGQEAGGTLCLAGDCPHCLCTVNGVAYLRACQIRAADGMEVTPHRVGTEPPLPADTGRAATSLIAAHADTVIIGQGESGRQAAADAKAAGKTVLAYDSKDGQEVAGIYDGPLVVVRTAEGLVNVHCSEVVVATGAAEIQPVAPGDRLKGLFTSRAVQELHSAGADLGHIVAIGEPPSGVDCEPAFGDLVRFEGTDSVEAVVVSGPDGAVTYECDSVSIGLGLYPRDVLLRMGSPDSTTAVGEVAGSYPLPPAPVEGTICACSNVTVGQVDSVWDRGFQELELVKRSTLAGTGTCQGMSCMPHLRAYIADRRGDSPTPFTARPLAKSITIGEAISNYQHPGFFRTGLHDFHQENGGRMDRFGPWWRPWDYGDPQSEYEAVRSRVSIMDVSTLGKMIVTGSDVVEFLERIYPTHIGTIKPGRSKYVLMLNEKGAVMDDGMVCREEGDRFTLTFTSSGVSFAEMWMRDWAESWGMDVRILNRTASRGAINVTGPLAGELMSAIGAPEMKFMDHRPVEIAGIDCQLFRLSFTGESSYEIHHPFDRSSELWNLLMEAGEPLGMIPHGLEALLTLRLEKGHIIVGQDTEADSTPRRLDHEWAVRLDKPEFLGRQAVIRTNEIPLDRKLVGLTMEGPAPDEGTVLYDDEGLSGYVTSARFSPALGKTVMLGWVRTVDGSFPNTLSADDRLAHRTETPFYDAGGERARV